MPIAGEFARSLGNKKEKVDPMKPPSIIARKLVSPQAIVAFLFAYQKARGASERLCP